MIIIKNITKNITATLTLISLIILTASCSSADAGRLFEEYLWEKRVIVIFSPTRDHPDYARQKTALDDAAPDFKTRDTIVWNIVYQEYVRADGHYKPQLSTNPFYDEFGVKRGEFAVFLIGKDGEIKQKSASFTPPQELIQRIDSMPMAQREKQNRGSP